MKYTLTIGVLLIIFIYSILNITLIGTLDAVYSSNSIRDDPSGVFLHNDP